MIRVRALGECVIQVGDQVVGPEAATLFALLLYLVLERGKRVGRSALVELLWPGVPDERARHCLRQTLYKIRQLGAEVEATSSHVALAAAQVRADFLDLAAGGAIDVRRLREGGAHSDEFLPGYAPAISRAFTEWLERQRDYAHSLVRRALSAALLDARARQCWGDVDAIARHCLRLDPLNEEATLALAEATALTGSKARALSILDRYVGELGAAARDISLPATVLRRRITERLPSPRYSAEADAIFVGRDDSVELLAALLREARGGAGRACLVWGAAGMGKSRLVAECTNAALLQGAQVARVGLQASDARRPLSAFVDLVPVLLTLPGALGCAPSSMRYLKRLTEHDASATAPSEDARDAEFLFSCIRQALFDLVDAVASESTLVVVVEDVHWVDQVSWEVLREMIDWSASRRLLFLFTSRAEHPTGAPERAPTLRLVRHHVGAIDDAAATALLTALSTEGGRAMGDELRAWCVAVAEGNPFFLNELARQWVETGESSRPPASLLGVLAERMSRLHPRSLRVLQACAVLARNATLEHLETVTQYPRHELLESLEELETAHLIGPQASAIRPRHAIIVDEALRRLPEAAKRLLHRGAALSLTREIEATRSAAALWDCARHWRLAGEGGRVQALVVSCATHLMEMGLPREAAEVYRTALELSELPGERRDLLNGLANALMCAGLWKQARRVVLDALHARVAADPFAASHCDAELDLMETDWRLDSPIHPLLIRALGCVNDVNAAPSHRLRAADIAMRLADVSVDAECALHVFRASESLSSRFPQRDAHFMTCSVTYHSSFGDLSIAVDAASELISRRRSEGNAAALARALRGSWIPRLRVGDFDGALDSTLEAFAIAERYRMAGDALAAASHLAAINLELDRLDQALSWALVSLDWARSTEERFSSGESILCYLRTLATSGDEPGAWARLPFGLDEILRMDRLRARVSWLALWATLAKQVEPRDRLDVAAGELERLWALCATAGGQDFNAHALVGLLDALGEKEKAVSTLTAYLSVRRRETSAVPSYLSAAMRRLGVGPSEHAGPRGLTP